MATLDAFPPAIPGRTLPSGIAVKVYPASLAYDVVIERAPDVGGAPGTWAILTRFRPTNIAGQVFQDRLTGNAATYWYRAYHAAPGYDDGAVTPQVSATVGVLTDQLLAQLTSLEYVKGLPAGTVAKQAHGVLLETFESDPHWDVKQTGASVTFPANGQAGGKVLRASGVWTALSPDNIPFDPSKLYRIRARVRLVTAPTDPATDTIYIGLAGVAADGVTLVNGVGANTYSSQHYYCASGADLGAGAALGDWQEFTGWFRGWGTAGGGPSTDPTAPRMMHANVRYLRAIAYLNYPGGDGVMELDEIAIDLFDEESQTRLYRLFQSSTVISAIATRTDLAQSRGLVSGRQRFTVRNGDVVTFAPVFQNIPQGRRLEGGISYEPRSVWSATGDLHTARCAITTGSATLTAPRGAFTASDAGLNVRVFGAGSGGTPLDTTVASFISATQVTLSASASTTVSDSETWLFSGTLHAPLTAAMERGVTFEGLSSSGCTIRARLRQKNSSVTARTDSFTGGALTTNGASSAANIANGPAYDGQYLVSWTGSITARVALSKTPDYCDVSGTIAIKSKAAAGSYVTRATRSYSCHASGLGTSRTVDLGGALSIAASEIDLNGDVQIMITDLTVTGNPLYPDTAVSVTPGTVKYSSGSNADQYASMTPDTDDAVVVEFELAG